MGVTDTLRIPRPARRTLHRAVLVPSWLSAAILALAFGAGLSLSPALQYAPLVASVVLFGLPHGAVDHLAVARARGAEADLRAMGRVVGLYAALGSAYAALWFLAPALSFALFIAITWLHWGQGDLYALLALADADHLGGPLHRLGTVVVRGGLPMLVPLLAFPDWYREVALDLVGLFAPGAVGVIDWAFRADVRLAVGVGYGLLIIATLGVGLLGATDRSAWALDAGETVGLVAHFALVPPVLAIGVYFCLWHSLRHVARLMLVDGSAADALGDRDIGSALAAFARDAAPLTAVSLLLIAGLAVAVPNPPDTVPEWVGLYLVFIAVVTLPHVVVVTLMDREQGVWTGSVEGGAD